MSLHDNPVRCVSRVSIGLAKHLPCDSKDPESFYCPAVREYVVEGVEWFTSYGQVLLPDFRRLVEGFGSYHRIMASERGASFVQLVYIAREHYPEKQFSRMTDLSTLIQAGHIEVLYQEWHMESQHFSECSITNPKWTDFLQAYCNKGTEFGDDVESYQGSGVDSSQT